jgi:hypothetical protein
MISSQIFIIGTQYMIHDEKKYGLKKITTCNLQEITIYLTRKLNQKPMISTFGQFDHLVILDKLF